MQGLYWKNVRNNKLLLKCMCVHVRMSVHACVFVTFSVQAQKNLRVFTKPGFIYISFSLSASHSRTKKPKRWLGYVCMHEYERGYRKTAKMQTQEINGKSECCCWGS